MLTNGLTPPVNYYYDTAGNPTAITDTNGRMTNFSYNERLQKLNRYTYVRNNPVNYVDSDGSVVQLLEAGEMD